MAPEFVADVLLRAFYLTEGKENPDGSAVMLIDDDYIRRFIQEAEDIHTSNGYIKAKIVNDLKGYMKGLVAALEDIEFLCGFDAFGEFLIQEILSLAKKRIEEEHLTWELPGTYISREIFFHEAMAICRHMNEMMPDDEQYDEMDFARHMCGDFMNVGTLMRGMPGGDLLFRHQDDAITSWNPAKETVPQFSVVTYSVEEIYGNDDSDGNTDKMTSFKVIG